MNYTFDRSDRRVAARWWSWAIAMICLCMLFYLNQVMDTLMNAERTRVVIREPFYPVHRVYLWTSTVQWVACLVWLALTLSAWSMPRAGDSDGGEITSSSVAIR
jgi:hypothetical protein